MAFFLLMLGSLVLMLVGAGVLATIIAVDWRAELLALLADEAGDGGAHPAPAGGADGDGAGDHGRRQVSSLLE